MKKLLLLCFITAFTVKAFTQTDSNTTFRPKIGILIPLSLDSAFKGGSYKFGNSVPKFILPQLEFYNGVQIALDVLEEEGIHADVFIVDSRKKGGYSAALADLSYRDLDLIIGNAQNNAELKAMTEAAQKEQIPFISASYPNDGNLSNNSLVIMNSTIKTHCHEMYKFIQKNNSTGNLVYFSKSTPIDERIKGYFNESEKNTASLPLNFKRQEPGTFLTDSILTMLLDSTIKNTIVVGSLDDAYSQTVLKQLAKLTKTYEIEVFGMPTWDDFSLTSEPYKGLTVYVSTPFITSSGNKTVYSAVQTRFKKMTNGRPGDMVFKGYEIAYRYIKTLSQSSSFMSNINNAQYKIFNSFDVQPVFNKAGNTTPDYYENKKIYFIKKTNGAITNVLGL